MIVFLEGAAYKITWICKLQNLCFFWKFHSGDVKLYSVPSIMISTWKHFKAVCFKIMFLENSKHMGFWNISWTHSPPFPRKLFLWKKMLLYVEQELFVPQWCYRDVYHNFYFSLWKLYVCAATALITILSNSTMYEHYILTYCSFFFCKM